MSEATAHVVRWTARIEEAQRALREMQDDLAERERRGAGTVRLRKRIEGARADLRAYHESRNSWLQTAYAGAVRRHLEAVTTHLPFEEYAALERRSQRGGNGSLPQSWPGPRSVDHHHGLWIECGSERRLNADFRETYPHAALLADLAASLGCAWVYLDQAADEIPGLPTFEW